MNFLVKAFCSLLKWLWQSSASPFLLPQWGDWWWQLCVGDELVELYCSSSAVLLGCSAAGAVVRCPLGHSAGLFWEKGSLTARWQLLAETVMVLWVEAQLSAPPPIFPSSITGDPLPNLVAFTPCITPVSLQSWKPRVSMCVLTLALAVFAGPIRLPSTDVTGSQEC